MKVFKVGGCVRDKLMGITPNDIDFVVVGSKPEEMLEAGFNLVGESFPVFLGKDGNEYALARTERKSGKGYTGFITDHNPDVTIEQDLFRRDLTINAMAERKRSFGEKLWTFLKTFSFDSFGAQLIDPFGGKNDIDNKVLRHVSEAFAEDPVRVLRIARFNARFGPEWTIAHETKCLIAQMIDDGVLEELTPERVWKELEKALSSDFPSLFFDALFEIGALNVIFPELSFFELEDIERHVKETLLDFGNETKSSNNPVTNFAKLCLLLDDSIVNLDNFFERLKVPNKHIKCFQIMKSLSKIFFTFEEPDELVFKLVDQSSLDKDMLKMCCFSMVGVNPLSNTVIDCFDAVKSVNFNCLTDIEKQTLQGAKIGSALAEIKRERIHSILHKKGD